MIVDPRNDRCHGALLRVDLKLEESFDEAGQAYHDHSTAPEHGPSSRSTKANGRSGVGRRQGPTSSGSNKFATDSPLEETGFEPSVPRRVATLSREPYPPLLHFPYRRKERAVRLACLNPDSSAEGAGFELLVPRLAGAREASSSGPRKKHVGLRGQVRDHTAQARRARPADGRRWIALRPFVSKSIGRQQRQIRSQSTIEDSSLRC